MGGRGRLHLPAPPARLRRPRRPAATPAAVACLLAAAAACSAVAGTGAFTSTPATLPHNVVPAPVLMRPTDAAFTVTRTTAIHTPRGSAEAGQVGTYLAGVLRPSTGYPLAVSQSSDGHAGNAITLTLTADASLGGEGYQLDVDGDAVVLRAHEPAGLFRGVQTLRQLMPPAVESATAHRGPWQVAGGHVEDRPRYAWRGAALDTARHFYSVEEVKRYIDLISLYKINMLHLRLGDDQGWRIAVDAAPRLAEVGGRSQAGGGTGGFYTKAQYTDIVNYARARYVTVVPELDMPGHSNAALSAYGELSCDGVAPPPYTGTGGPPRSLCVDKPSTYTFLDRVLGELAAMTPGPYIDIGGDEVENLTTAQYVSFVQQVQAIVAAHGKRVLGWQEIAQAALRPDTVGEFWSTGTPPAALVAAAKAGTKVVMSPASKAYFDMKYDKGTTLGRQWAGYIDVRDAYSWDPATVLPGVGDGSVLGVEAQAFSETFASMADLEYMVFPRLPALAEVGWSPAGSNDWNSFSHRLAAQAPRWSARSVNFYRSPQVPWPG